MRVAPARSPYGDGDDAARLVEAVAFSLDPWQRLVLRDWLARDERDRFCYTTCGLSVPRQNGKNALLEPRELYGMVANGEHILHTAHQVKTSKKAFRRLAGIFTDRRNRELNRMVAEIRRTNGEEAIHLTNGGSIEYSARSRGAARGWTVDTVVFDEAQELTDEQLEALMSTLAAAPSGNRQLVYTGTPPGPGSPGEVFARVRKACVERPSARACWHEWGVEEIGDVEDRDRWYAANPALGIRISEEFVAEEARTMSADGFARERLGWWSGARADAAIPPGVWDASRGSAPAAGKRAFGVKILPDGSQVALSGCVLPEEGPAFVELVGLATLADGLEWLVSFLTDERRAERTAAVAVDGRNGADALLDKLRCAYPRQAVVAPGTRGVVAACGMALEALRSGELLHPAADASEKQAALDRSARTSPKRPIGSDGGWGFGGEDAAPAESAALAYWAARTTRRNPEEGGFVLWR